MSWTTDEDGRRGPSYSNVSVLVSIPMQQYVSRPSIKTTIMNVQWDERAQCQCATVEWHGCYYRAEQRGTNDWRITA